MRKLLSLAVICSVLPSLASAQKLAVPPRLLTVSSGNVVFAVSEESGVISRCEVGGGRGEQTQLLCFTHGRLTPVNLAGNLSLDLNSAGVLVITNRVGRTLTTCFGRGATREGEVSNACATQALP